MNKYIKMAQEYEERYGEDFFDSQYYPIMPYDDSEREKIEKRFGEILEENDLDDEGERIVETSTDFLFGIDWDDSEDRKRFKLFAKMMREEFGRDILDLIIEDYQEQEKKGALEDADKDYLNFLLDLKDEEDEEEIEEDEDVDEEDEDEEDEDEEDEDEETADAIGRHKKNTFYALIDLEKPTNFNPESVTKTFVKEFQAQLGHHVTHYAYSIETIIDPDIFSNSQRTESFQIVLTFVSKDTLSSFSDLIKAEDTISEIIDFLNEKSNLNFAIKHITVRPVPRCAL